MCYMWRCPGCGALVGLPAAASAPIDTQAEIRLDQLAKASCGCWVDVLSERGLARLLQAMVAMDGDYCRPARIIVARRF